MTPTPAQQQISVNESFVSAHKLIVFVRDLRFLVSEADMLKKGNGRRDLCSTHCFKTHTT